MGMSGDPLSHGLRALETLAVHAPLDLAQFAEMNGLSNGDALDLLGTFEQVGYVERIPDQALFVLTPLALNLMPAANAAGRLN